MRRLDHFGKGFGNRILSVVSVLQLMLEQSSEVGVERRILDSEPSIDVDGCLSSFGAPLAYAKRS